MTNTDLKLQPELQDLFNNLKKDSANPELAFCSAKQAQIILAKLLANKKIVVEALIPSFHWVGAKEILEKRKKMADRFLVNHSELKKQSTKSNFSYWSNKEIKMSVYLLPDLVVIIGKQAIFVKDKLIGASFRAIFELFWLEAGK